MVWRILFILVSWFAWLKRRLHPLPHPYKDIADLSVSDLERCPVWEYALDMEGEAGFDECTVRPRPDVSVCEPDTLDAAMVFVRARFHAADGTVFYGSLTPCREEGIASQQPMIFLGRRRVCFAIPGCEIDPQAEVRRCYRQLRKRADQLFPMSFVPAVPVRGLVAGGNIDGFTYTDFDTNREQVLT